MQLKPGTKLQNGKYEITRVLGQGGFGITYLAEHSLMDRRVCIKEFFVKEYCDRKEETSQVSLGAKGNAELMRRYMAKFIKEAQTVANLSHGNIVHIYDSFYENNTAYAVMEYIEGCTLAEWVRDHGPVPEERAVDYMRQIGAALSYAHDHRVMHLDVKPSNIMLAEDGKKAILIDFGMAKHYGESGEQTSNTPVGVSHGYAPLEQYKVGGVKGFSPPTDIYALGATMLFALTGERPAHAAELMAQDGLQRVDGDFSPSVKDAILMAMRSKKELRPQRVKDFLTLLDTPEEPDVTILSVEIEPDPVIRPKANDRPMMKSSFIGPAVPHHKTARLPIITIVYLALALVVGALAIWFIWDIRKEMAQEAWNPSPGWDPGFILSTVGALIAEIGILFLLCKWKCGSGLFVSGGLICLFMMALALFETWGDRLFAAMVGVVLLLVIVGITSLVLSIKGKQGLSGWQQQRKGFPKSLKQLFHH